MTTTPRALLGDEKPDPTPSADQREEALAALERLASGVQTGEWIDAVHSFIQRDVALVRAALTPPPLPDSVEEVSALIAAERERQVAKGYDDAHDDEHGIPHLVTWAQAYIHRGEPIKAMAILASVLDVHERAQAAPLPADLAKGKAAAEHSRHWHHYEAADFMDAAVAELAELRARPALTLEEIHALLAPGFCPLKTLRSARAKLRTLGEGAGS